MCPFFGSLHGPSGVMNAIPQGGVFQFSPSSEALGYVSRVQGVFSNRDHLPSTSGPLLCYKKELVIFSLVVIFTFYILLIVAYLILLIFFCALSSGGWLVRVIFLAGGERRVIALTTSTRS